LHRNRHGAEERDEELTERFGAVQLDDGTPSGATTSRAKSGINIHQGNPLLQFEIEFYSGMVGKTASHAAKETAWELMKTAHRIFLKAERMGRSISWPVYKTVRNDVQKMLPNVLYDYAIRDNETDEIVTVRDQKVIKRVTDWPKKEVLYNAARLKVRSLNKALLKLSL
jgi:hypothetical protein